MGFKGVSAFVTTFQALLLPRGFYDLVPKKNGRGHLAMVSKTNFVLLSGDRIWNYFHILVILRNLAQF